MENNIGNAFKQAGVNILFAVSAGVYLGFCAAVTVRIYKTWSELLDSGHERFQKFTERMDKKIDECFTKKKNQGNS